MYGISRSKGQSQTSNGFSTTITNSKWKWEVLTIDFIAKLPKIVGQHDSIMVVVENSTQDTHFILVKLTHKETNIIKSTWRLSSCMGYLMQLFQTKIQILLQTFWKGLFKGFGTNMNFNIGYHPQTDE
jgi:hypothetical protein